MVGELKEFPRTVRDAQYRKLQRDIDEHVERIMRARELKKELEAADKRYQKRKNRFLWVAVVCLGAALLVLGVMGMLK